MKMNHRKGFTLIEVIIYIALFSLLLGTAFTATFELINESSKLGTRNTLQEEGNFVIRKMNNLMTGASSFSTSGAQLVVNKYDGEKYIVKLGSGVDSGRIMVNDTGSFIPITTDNIEVMSLNFEKIGSNMTGILTIIKIKNKGTDAVDFKILKYIRK